MLRRLVLATALVAANAFAQQNTDISGADFSSGKADAALAALGRAAAASGNRLVITAPPEWHAKIAQKVKAGGNAELALRDGFYENVLVRIEAKAAPAAAGEPERVSRAEVERSRAEADRAKAEAERSRAEADKAKAEAERLRAEADKAKAEAELAKAQAQRAAAAVPAAPPAATAKPAPAGESAADAIRKRLEQSLVNGRGAEGTLAVAALQQGDTIYVDEPVRAVVRREGVRPVLYWLDGELDLRRAELKVVAENRYQVMTPIRGESGTLRSEFVHAGPLEAREPAAGSPVRSAFEQSLNQGRPIEERLAVTALRNGDQVYTGDGAAVVVRRDGNNLRRYWLEGSLDPRHAAVRADGANKYRIVGDSLR